MANINIGNFFLSLADFIADVGNKIYGLLFYRVHLPLFNLDCYLYQIISVISVALLATILVIRIIRG